MKYWSRSSRDYFEREDDEKMKKGEADAIIANYKSHAGFFGLSRKPECLSKDKYAGILRIQNFLAERNKHKEYYQQPFNKHEWDKLKKLAADLQMIIFQYWGDEIFEVGKKAELMPV